MSNKIYVEGKTLKQISEESGVPLNTVKGRYYKNGYRTYSELSAEHLKNRSGRPKGRESHFYIPQVGRRMYDYILENDIPVAQIIRETGISKATIFAFLSSGRDITVSRFMKLCSAVGVSADYILGLKRDK